MPLSAICRPPSAIRLQFYVLPCPTSPGLREVAPMVPTSRFLSGERRRRDEHRGFAEVELLGRAWRQALPDVVQRRKALSKAFCVPIDATLLPHERADRVRRHLRRSPVG